MPTAVAALNLRLRHPHLILAQRRRTLDPGLQHDMPSRLARLADRLHLTLDGVHLNPAGAEMVAEAFAAAVAGVPR